MKIRLPLACLALLAGALPLVTAPAEAHEPRWMLRSASVNANPATIVGTAPPGESMEVVFTSATADGPRITTTPVTNAAEARKVIEAAQDKDSTLAVGMAQPVAIAEADPLRSQQWALDPGHLSASSVWATTKGGGVTVAVVDTGVSGNHPDLAGRVLKGFDMSGRTAGGDIDTDGHGTHVAGIIAATLDNGIGIAGMAPSVKILPVRVAPDGATTSAVLAEGIKWAVDNHADVINLSLGGTQSDPNLDNIIQYAAAKNVVVVAAAGNERGRGNGTFYPAAYRNVMAVGAIDIDTDVAPFSNSGSYVDVVAPGVHILSTYIPNNYGFLDGTSMASPYAAATAAIVIAETGSGYTAATVMQQIQSTATDIGASGRDNLSGFGVVSPLNALTAADCPGGTSALTRVCGPNRYGTAANLSKASFSPGVPTAYVASGVVFADALGGGAAAARNGAPLLLVQPGIVPVETKDELTRLAPDRIIVLGGPGAISDNVVQSLRGFTSGDVTRLFGADRYETAGAVAQATFPAGADTAYLASGTAFPDALSGVPAAARAGAPLLLTRKASLPAATGAALSALGVKRIVVLGGTGAVSSAVEASLRSFGTVTRIWGPDRYSTSAATSRLAFAGGAGTVYLASGTQFPDALAGGAIGGGLGSPILLTSRTSLPSSVLTEIDRLNATRVVIMGGTAAVSDTVERQVAAALAN